MLPNRRRLAGVVATLLGVTGFAMGAPKIVHAASPCYYTEFPDPLGTVAHLVDSDVVEETMSIWQITGAGSVGCTPWANHAWGDTEVEISWYTEDGTLLADGPNNPDVSLSIQAWTKDLTPYNDNYFVYGTNWEGLESNTGALAVTFYDAGGGPKGDVQSGNFVTPIVDLAYGNNGGTVCGLTMSDGYGHPDGGGAAHTRYVDSSGHIYTTSGHLFSSPDFLAGGGTCWD